MKSCCCTTAGKFRANSCINHIADAIQTTREKRWKDCMWTLNDGGWYRKSTGSRKMWKDQCCKAVKQPAWRKSLDLDKPSSKSGSFITLGKVIVTKCSHLPAMLSIPLYHSVTRINVTASLQSINYIQVLVYQPHMS